MAKIRTVKPDLFRHDALFDAEQKYQLPLRLAFIGLFTCCDREGRFRWKPKQLKLDVFPFDDLDMSAVLDALAACHFVQKYTFEGEMYGCVPSWHKHQCVNHREAETQLPAPEVDETPPKKSLKNSTLEKNTGQLPDNAEACLGTPRGKWKWKGSGKELEVEMEKEKEKEQEREKEVELNVVASRTRTSHEREHLEIVFAHWKKTFGHPNAKLDDARQKIIRQALKGGYTVLQLCQAIDGCRQTPHNMGVNEKGQRYDGLQVVLRNADQIDRFIHNCHNPPQVPNESSTRLQSNVHALQAWVSQKTNTEETHHAHP